jgi:hypothetical protein
MAVGLGCEWWLSKRFAMLSDLDLVPDRDASEPDRLEGAVADACRLVGTSDEAIIRSVTVVGDRRLTGAEVLRVRERAEAWGVRVAMDGGGAVTLRRAEATRHGAAADETTAGIQRGEVRLIVVRGAPPRPWWRCLLRGLREG